MMWDGENYKAADIIAIAAGLQPHGWTFDVYGREWKTGLKAPDNMKFHANKPTEEVIAAAQAATFLLIYPSATSWYVTDRMTGSLPLAISQGSPIVTTTSFAGVYGMDSSTGVLAAGSAEQAVQMVVGTTESQYRGLLDGMASFRLRAWVHAVHTLEDLLLSVPGIGQAVKEQEQEKDGAKGGAAAGKGDTAPPWQPLSMPLKFPKWSAQEGK